MFLRTTFPRLFLVLLTLIILSGTTSFIGAQCAYDAATDSWGCGTLDDSLTINDTVGGRISLDGGNDTLILDSLARIGTSSTVANDVVLMGDGDDSVYNDGTIGAVPTGTIQDYQRGLNCGPGDDILVNAGLIDGPVSCDDGADTVINLPGAITQQINGGAGPDSLVNEGSIDAGTTLWTWDASLDGGDGDNTLVNQPFAYVNGYLLGQSGADSLVNSGYVRSGIVSGSNIPSGNDTLINNPGAYVGFMMGASGNDSFVNGGYVASGMRDGNGGNDTFINLPFAYSGGVMEGGFGDDSLANSGYSESVSGERGNDTLVNAAYGVVGRYLTAGAGNDSLVNNGYVGQQPSAGLSPDDLGMLGGDDGDDTVVNNGGAFAISMDGGDGSDSLVNRGGLGFHTMRLAGAGAPQFMPDGDMRGGAGNDTLLNEAGAIAFEMLGGVGNDSIVNSGGGGYFITAISHLITPSLPLSGGDGDDTLVNAAGAWASSMEGDGGADSLVNAGYLSGTLSGGDGSDTVVNATGAYAGFIDLGAGDDLFTNEGFVNTYGTLGSNYGVDCGDGNDTVNVGGYIIGSILCGGGADSVTVGPHWLLPGIGSPVIGTLDGGVGVDTLTFAFTVSVGSQTEADDLAAALTAASPAGGTITIAGVPYAWTNFETLVNLLSFTINQPVVITLNGPRRVNASDAAAPVAIYCAADAVEVWTVGEDGAGSFNFSVPSADVSAGTSVSANGVSFTAAGGGAFSVSATASDGKPYAFTGSCG